MEWAVKPGSFRFTCREIRNDKTGWLDEGVPLWIELKLNRFLTRDSKNYSGPNPWPFICISPALGFVGLPRLWRDA